MPRLLWALAAVLLIASGPVLAQANLHDASGTITDLLELIRNSANSWSDRLRGFAVTIFWMLATISLVLTMAPLLFRQADFGEIIGELVKFILTTGFFAALLLYSVEWADAIVNSFRQAAAHAAGVGGQLYPGDMFALAVELAKTVSDVDTWNPMVAGSVGLAAIVILLCFTFIAAFMGVTLVESYVVINAAVLFMGFGGSPHTREYAVSMMKYAVAVGAKLFVLTLIVGLILDSANNWQLAYNTQHDEASMWTMVGLSLICAYLSKSIPDLIQGLITGVSSSGGSILGGMAAAGAAGAAAGMAFMSSQFGSSSLLGGAGKSASDLLKSSFGGGGSSAPASMMNSASSVGGGSSGPSPRVGGGINPASATSGTPPAPGGIKTAAKAATAAAVRSTGVLSAMAVPGMEGAAELAMPGPPPTDSELADMQDTPENIIRPADSNESPIDTMSSMRDALNNRGKQS